MKTKLFIISLVVCLFPGCSLFEKRIPKRPAELPPVKVERVQAKVDAGVESLLRQKQSFVTMEEQFLFLQKLSEEIERLTDQTDEEALDTPIPSPTPLP
jgi:hypothetical protein